MNTTQALPWDREPRSESLRIDRIETAVREAAPQWGHEFGPPRRGHAFVPAGAARRHAAIVAGALLAALGLGWIAGSSLHGLFSPDPAPPPLEHGSNAAARASDADKATIVGTAKSDREAIRAQPDAWSGATAPGRIGGHEPASGTAPKVIRSAIASPSSARQDSPPARPAPSAADGRTKLVPFPETRPTTVQGWVVRDVAGSMVVLEGPNGVFRTTTGETVPGVGKVDFIVRWGSRWIVGTSKGLITTP